MEIQLSDRVTQRRCNVFWSLTTVTRTPSPGYTSHVPGVGCITSRKISRPRRRSAFHAHDDVAFLERSFWISRHADERKPCVGIANLPLLPLLSCVAVGRSVARRSTCGATERPAPRPVGVWGKQAPRWRCGRGMQKGNDRAIANWSCRP